MRYYTLCFYLLLALISFSAEGADFIPKEINIVFDLDWTLIYATRENSENVADVVLSSIESYKLADGAAEIIDYLSNIPGVKISFFSGGPADRNKKILQGLMLPSGKSAFDVAYKILSKEELESRPNVSESSHFSLRFRKNLEKISKQTSNLLMLEDSPQFIDLSQLDSVIWIGNPYEYVDRPELVSDLNFRANLHYLPNNLLEWQLERTKLIWGFGVLMKIIDMVNARKAGSLTEGYRIIFGKSEDAYSKPNPSTEKYVHFFKTGYEELKAAYPNFSVLKSFAKTTKPLNSLIYCKDVTL
jgi:hypothetical protein